MVIVRKLRIAFHIKNLACSVPFIQTQETIPIAAQSENILIAILEQYLTYPADSEGTNLPADFHIPAAHPEYPHRY